MPEQHHQHDMTQDDAARIQSTQAQAGKDMSSQGFAARAQSAGDRNANNMGHDTNRDRAHDDHENLFGEEHDHDHTPCQDHTHDHGVGHEHAGGQKK